MGKKFRMSDLLNAQSMTAAEQTDPKFRISEVEIDKIDFNPQNFYQVDQDKIAELAANIEQFGLMHNIVVKQQGEMFLCISGERRLRAYQMLHEKQGEKWSRIPALVLPDTSNTDVISKSIDDLRLIYGNATTRVLSDYEKVKQAEEIRKLLRNLKDSGFEFVGKMRTYVAEILNVSETQVARMESVSRNLSPELKQDFANGKMGISAAYEASRLDDAGQAEVHEAAAAGPVQIGDVRKVAAPADQKTKSDPDDKWDPVKKICSGTDRIKFVTHCGGGIAVNTVFYDRDGISWLLKKLTAISAVWPDEVEEEKE